MSRQKKKGPDGLSFDELRRQIKERRLAPLYLFVGEEAYFHEQALRLLRDSLDEAFRMFNFAVLSLDGTSGERAAAAAALDLANQLPMLSDRRVVVVRDFDKMGEAEVELTTEYLKRPAETASVVFQAAALDQRRKLSAALLKACTVAAFDRLTENEAMRRAERYLKNQGCQIDAGALKQLIGLTGTRLHRLINELNKLATYAGGGYITSTMVEALVPRAREHTGWELQDAVMGRDRQRALRLLARLLDDRAEPLTILGALAALYRRMLMVKDLIAANAPAEEVNKATGKFGPFAKTFVGAVMRLPRPEIAHGLRRIAQVDAAIKNSEATARLQLEYLVAELTK